MHLIIRNLDSSGTKILVPEGPARFRQWLRERERSTEMMTYSFRPGSSNEDELAPQPPRRAAHRNVKVSLRVK